MKKILTIILLTATFFNSNAQIILKKKDVSAKLNEIENEINNKNFEKALNIFQSKSEIILERNVRKKNREQFEHISLILSKKEKLMIKNEKEVSACIRDYNSYKYCDAISCLNIKINSENAYSRTIADFKILLPIIQEAVGKCSTYSTKIKKWQLEYENEEYNKLFKSVLVIDKHEAGFIPSNDKVQFENLKRNLEAKIEEQNREQQILREIYIYPIESEIKKIKLGQLTYLKSENHIELLTDLSSRLNREVKMNPIKYDNLKNEIRQLKTEVHKVLNNLKAYSKKNKPQYINLVKLYNDFAGEGMFGKPIYTDVQIDHFWGYDYKGKTIISSGTVYEIAETVFGTSTYITIKLSTSHYVDLYVDSSEEEKLLGISKGQKIKFIGEMDYLGSGIITHHQIKHVKILGVY